MQAHTVHGKRKKEIKKMRGKGWQGFCTYPYARHDNVIVWAMANLDDWVGSYKVDMMQHQVARI
jgi:hypothetical protein